MKSLFNDYLAFNADGNDLASKAYNMAGDLIAEYLKLGYSPRDISHIIISSVMCVESQYCIDYSLNKRR